MTNPKCYLCSEEINGDFLNNDKKCSINCPYPGRYYTTLEIINDKDDYQKNEKNELLRNPDEKIESSPVNKATKLDIINNIINNKHPSIVEQMEKFILYIGDQVNELGKQIKLGKDAYDKLKPTIGLINNKDINKLIEFLEKEDLLNSSQLNQGKYDYVFLTLDGLERYEELKKGSTGRKLGLMAMKFGDIDLDKIFEDFFKPAVEETDFELVRLNKQPTTGIIDDHLRIDIRKSKFLIADLTDGNQGAYWEAGFAEGLGIPVIYSCEKSKFDKEKINFDINFRQTILWENTEEGLKEASKKLKDTIRNTFPSETHIKKNIKTEEKKRI